jgi:hypothetical protein
MQIPTPRTPFSSMAREGSTAAVAIRRRSPRARAGTPGPSRAHALVESER